MNFLINNINKLINKRRFLKLKNYSRNDFFRTYEKVENFKISDEEYKEKILPYWKKYGKKPKKEYFEYYGYLNQKINPKIISDEILMADLYPRMNDTRYDEFLDNKLYLDFLLPEVKKSKNIIRFINKHYFDENLNFIDFHHVEKILNRYKKLIIKPAGERKGNGVEILNLSDNYENSLAVIKDKEERGDFIIQELVIQSEQLMNFNSSSLNTIRVISFIFENEVHVLSAILRVGKEGSEVDNYAKGGDSRPIDINGFLADYVFNMENKVTIDRQGNEYKKEKLIGYEKIVETVKKSHKKLVHMSWIGWDFGIDENYNPILIEINGFAGDNQREDREAFGDLTDKVLDKYLL